MELAADLGAILPAAELRYGSSFADFDNDGRLDLATAPRVRELGRRQAAHLAQPRRQPAAVRRCGRHPHLVDVQPFGNAETLCWADVNGDGFVNLFVPVYPDWAGGRPGNFFLRNLGSAGGDWLGF